MPALSASQTVMSRETSSLEGLVMLYGALERTARAKGLNPDSPAHLSKVTQTL